MNSWRPKNDTERSVYAAAFVEAFNRMHSYGWRSESGLTLEDWETQCAHNAVHEAEGLVYLHRRGMASKRELERDE